MALASLWRTLGVAENVLIFVAALVALVSSLGLISVMLVTLGQRRRELAVLRSIGAGPRLVFGLLTLESTLVMVVGVFAGVLLTWVASEVLQPWVQTQFGFQLIDFTELKQAHWIALGFAAFGSFLGCIPAWQAYRQQLQDGLTPRH